MTRPINWKPLKVILQHQPPVDVGKPIPMTVFQNNHPKDCGDPWIGAYSKHGFWYKFSYGDQCDYDKTVALSFEKDAYFLNYESLDVWRNIFKQNFQYLVAKNQRDDVLGSVAYACYENFAVIGIYYVMEEYRHSGIGEKLFKEVLKFLRGKIVIFHAMSHLKEKCYRFGFNIKPKNWQFIHYTIQNPSGYLNLKVENNIFVKPFTCLDTAEVDALRCFDTKICGHARYSWITEWLTHCDSETVVAYDEAKTVIGYGHIREVSGGYVKRLLVAPLYAISKDVSKILIFELCKKFYNPDEDFEWDPDAFAIYRRNIHFMVPASNCSMVEVMNIFKGENGILTKDRLFYETYCSDMQPKVELENVYAASDLHLAII